MDESAGNAVFDEHEQYTATDRKQQKKNAQAIVL